MVNWTPGISLEAMEKMIILQAYAHYQKNKEQTCKSLGISVRNLEYKLKAYEETEEIFRLAQIKTKEENEKLIHRMRFGDRVPAPSNALPIPPPQPAPLDPVQVTKLRRRTK